MSAGSKASVLNTGPKPEQAFDWYGGALIRCIVLLCLCIKLRKLPNLRRLVVAEHIQNPQRELDTEPRETLLYRKPAIPPEKDVGRELRTDTMPPIGKCRWEWRFVMLAEPGLVSAVIALILATKVDAVAAL